MRISDWSSDVCSSDLVRWLLEVWQAAKSVRQDGVDLRAVTLWSLFGNVDWRSLLTRKEGVYDVGAFDTRGMKPRATLVARAATALARDGGFDHPLLDTPGWWRRPERFYPWNESPLQRSLSARPLLIIGATGTLGQAMGRICQHRGLAYCLTSRRSEEHTSELQSLMRISYAVFCLKNKKLQSNNTQHDKRQNPTT